MQGVQYAKLKQEDERLVEKTRRRFIKSAVASFAVAIPAVQTLASRASADPSCGCGDPCSSMRSVYQGNWCGPYTGCPVGNNENCYGIYYYYSIINGQYCGEETVSLGRCR